MEDLKDHDYCHPGITECIIYYITGYLYNHILNRIKCDFCKNAFIDSNTSFVPNIIPINIEKQLFVHPNLKLFNFIKYLEALFCKYCHRTDVYDTILDNINVGLYNFPCEEHNDIILSQIIDFYIRMRMRQYCNKINIEEKKINQNVKKSAKFYKT